MSSARSGSRRSRPPRAALTILALRSDVFRAHPFSTALAGTAGLPCFTKTLTSSGACVRLVPEQRVAHSFSLAGSSTLPLRVGGGVTLRRRHRNSEPMDDAGRALRAHPYDFGIRAGRPLAGSGSADILDCGQLGAGPAVMLCLRFVAGVVSRCSACMERCCFEADVAWPRRSKGTRAPSCW